jgi:hypothetical protein
VQDSAKSRGRGHARPPDGGSWSAQSSVLQWRSAGGTRSGGRDDQVNTRAPGSLKPPRPKHRTPGRRRHRGPRKEPSRPYRTTFSMSAYRCEGIPLIGLNR